MRLELINRSCGCTTAKALTPDVPPNGIGRVEVVVNISPTTQRHRETVTLSTGLAEPKSLRLTLDADAYRRLDVEFLAPTPLPVALGEKALCEFELVAYTPASEPIGSFRATLRPARGDITLSEPRSRSLGEVRELRARGAVQVEAPGDATRFPELQIAAEYGTASAQIQIPVTLRRSVRSSPTTLFVNRQASPEAGTTFEVRADIPVAILRIESSAAGLEVDGASDQAAQVHRLALKTNATFVIGRSERHWLRIHTDHPRQSILQIPVFVFMGSRAPAQHEQP